MYVCMCAQVASAHTHTLTMSVSRHPTRKNKSSLSGSLYISLAALTTPLHGGLGGTKAKPKSNLMCSLFCHLHYAQSDSASMRLSSCQNSAEHFTSLLLLRTNGSAGDMADALGTCVQHSLQKHGHLAAHCTWQDSFSKLAEPKPGFERPQRCALGTKLSSPPPLAKIPRQPPVQLG